MIIQIRKQIQGKAVRIIVFIIMALFILPLPMTQLFNFLFNKGTWVASINNHIISPEAVTRRAAVQDYQIRALRQRFGEYADFYMQLMGLNRDPHEIAFESLMHDELLNQAIAKLGWSFPSEYIVEKMHDPLYVIKNLSMIIPPQLLDAQGINPIALRNYLRQMALSQNEFDTQVAQALLRRLFDEVVTKAAYVPQFVLRDYFITEFSGKQFSIATLSLDDFIKKEEKNGVSSQDLKKFFDDQNAQAKRYFVPEKRSGIVWQFDPANYGIKIEVEAINSYYNAHKADYKDTSATIQVRRILIGKDEKNAQEKAEILYKQLVKSPNTFSDVAIKNSDDKETVSKGGLMPFFEQGKYDREFEKSAFALSKPGDISSVITTKEGYEIIQLVEKKAATYKALNVVKNEIENILIQQQFNKGFISDARKAIEENKTNPQAISDFITQKQGKRIELTQTTATRAPFVKSLFRIASPHSYVADQEGDLGAIVELTAIEKGHIPSLESIENNVKKDLYIQRAEAALSLALHNYLKDAQGKTEAEFAQLFGNKVEKSGMITPKDKEAINKLNAKGISPERIFQLEKVGMVTVAKGKGNGHLIRLDAIEPFNEKEFESHKKQIKRQIKEQEEQLVFGGFVASLYRSATIKKINL